MTSPYWSVLDDAVSRLAGEQVAIRRHLHRHPECSGEERETSKFVAAKLEAAGLQPRLLRDGLGVAADLTLGDPPQDPPRVALRADIDALPIRDEKTAEYRSCVPGVMHACGHDGHAAIVLSAAMAASAVRDAWTKTGGPGLRLRFLFQPAEEDSRGAQWLIEQGLLEGIAAILAVHMEPHFPAGHAGVRYGVLTAACDEVRISIAGQGGHAARPYQTRDPVFAAAQLITSLYAILPRRIDARSPAVLTIANLAAGRTHNAIPERAEISGTLRTIDPDSRQAILDRVVDVCAGVSTMTGTTVTPEFRHAIPSVVNDSRLSAALERASADVLGPDHVTRIDLPSLGGEDFAFYTQHIPGAMLRLGCTSPGATPHFLHSSRFDIDERCLPLGSRILLRAAALAATK
ncbi:MAG: amidohydrolase [Planctomycetota bacterium]|nr:amidohydrolase [Planctomycetaceae bacterium]MDQ3329900.1 amidohydrolase [Planctomycetota bacterium]